MQSNKFKKTEIGLIPENWTICLLKDLAFVQVGFPFKSKLYSLDKGTLVVRGENLSSGYFRWDVPKRWINIDEKIKNYLLSENLIKSSAVYCTLMCR